MRGQGCAFHFVPHFKSFWLKRLKQQFATSHACPTFLVLLGSQSAFGTAVDRGTLHDIRVVRVNWCGRSSTMRLGSSPCDGSEPEGDRCARQEASVSEVQMFDEKCGPAEDQRTSKVQKMLRQAKRQPSVMLLRGYLENKQSVVTFGIFWQCRISFWVLFCSWNHNSFQDEPTNKQLA